MKKAFQIIGILLCIVFLVGFGLCGAFGLTITASSALGAGLSETAILLGLSAAGLTISYWSGKAIAKLFRDMRDEQDERRP